jgi:hypothetical protein
MADFDDFSLEMVRGTYYRYRVTITVAATGLPQDLTGFQKFTSSAKRWYGDLDADAVFVKTSTAGAITVVNAALGIIEVALQPADTSGLPNRRTRLFVDAKCLDPVAHPLVPARGILTVLPTVTETNS